MHGSQGTQTANPHSYPEPALADKAAAQLLGEGLRRYSRFQFADWSVQNFSNNVLLVYFLWKFVKGENTHRCSVECKYEMTAQQHTKIARYSPICMNTYQWKVPPCATDLSNMLQVRGGEQSRIFFRPRLQTGDEPTSIAFATLTTRQHRGWVAVRPLGRCSPLPAPSQLNYSAGPTLWGRDNDNQQKSSPAWENDIIPSERSGKAGGWLPSGVAKQLLFVARSIKTSFKFKFRSKQRGWGKVERKTAPEAIHKIHVG